MNLTNANRDERLELTMLEVEEEFRNTVEVWTVGELKKALADIADDTKLIFSPADEPGSDLTGPEQVAFSAGVNESRVEGRRTVTTRSTI